MDSFIKTQSVSRVYSSDEIRTIALNNINLEIKKGEFVAIMGPSGCGKTTLLNILGLIDNPTFGNYYFMGNNMAVLPNKEISKIRKENIGFIFQSFNLIDELTVFENVELPLIYLKYSYESRKKRVEEVLDQMNMIHRRNHFPSQLSGGQQQRVAISRAVIAQPLLLLADEPTGNLDSVNGEEVMNMLTDLNQNGTTIIIVTHSQRDAEFSQRIIRLFDGKIIHENINPANYGKPQIIIG